MALLANQSKMDGDVTDQVLEFWVPTQSYVPWNQRSCLEPTWKIDDVEYFADKDIPMLIPGVGSQGGSAPEVMKKLRNTGYPICLARINSSSGLTHPWKKAPAPDDYLERVMTNLAKLIKETSL